MGASGITDGSGCLRQMGPRQAPRWAGVLGCVGVAALLASPALGPVEAAPMVQLGLVGTVEVGAGLADAGGGGEDAAEPRTVTGARAPGEASERSAMVRVRGTVGGGIYRSARAAGASPAAVQQYLRAIDTRLLLEEDILPSDAFDLVIARRAHGTARAGDLLYAGLEREGKPRVELLRWGRQGRMIDPGDVGGGGGTGGVGEGRGARAFRFAGPVAGRVTSRFGPRRHPILGYVRMHAGIDIKAAHGAPVRAPADGRVAFAGWHGGHGTYVRLAHAGGLGSGYAHLSRLAVAAGRHVRAGEVIGYVGSTGLSTGPHLHYELYRGGRAVDPRSVGPIAAAGNAASSADAALRVAMEARIDALRRLPAAAPKPLPTPSRATIAEAAPAAD